MNEPLAEKFFPDSNMSNVKLKNNYIEKYLISKLPGSDSKNISKDLQYSYILDRYSQDKLKKPLRIKRNFLTRKQRKQLNLLKLPKDGWDLASLESIKIMWKQYMRCNLGLFKRTPNCHEQEWANFSTIVSKCELIGAEVTVIRSKVPSQIGISGVLVLETKMTFQLVTRQSKLRTILKETAVFEFQLDNMKFTVFGKHLLTRPSERSVKKIKSHMVPDL
ncbi:hypothetical protein WA026_012685 [Henosepilachna vigintioctopunctata]|uniref:Ribonuclease P protein subunit p29 n=1 Tax=Henosepilachna vigintioctopunctata TaxID=420089 RepID=A0AAW1UAQ5_9CUCU